MRLAKPVGSVLIAALRLIYRFERRSGEVTLFNDYFNFVPGELVHEFFPCLPTRFAVPYSAFYRRGAVRIDAGHIGKKIFILSIGVNNARTLRPACRDIVFIDIPLFFRLIVKGRAVFVENEVGVKAGRHKDFIDKLLT